MATRDAMGTLEFLIDTLSELMSALTFHTSLLTRVSRLLDSPLTERMKSNSQWYSPLSGSNPQHLYLEVNMSIHQGRRVRCLNVLNAINQTEKAQLYYE